MKMSDYVRSIVCAVVLFGAACVGLSAAQATAPIMYKGRLVHPTRLLAKAATVAQPTAFRSYLAAHNLQATHASSLVPGLVVLDVASPALARATGAAGAEDSSGLARQLAGRIAALRESGLFAFVEPDYLVFSSESPTDARYIDGTLWGLRNTGQNYGVAGVDIAAEQAWELTTGSSAVIVAVVDSGIHYTHKDLAAQMWRNPGEIPGNGKDDDGNGFVDDIFGIDAAAHSGDPADDSGHGTHVAGTIGAAANDGNPMVGVAWEVRLMACRFLTANGTGQTSHAITCIDYAVAHGAKIINCSWGGFGQSAALREALMAASAAGVLVVAAAGNEENDNDHNPAYPASFDVPNLVAVAAIDRQGYRANFSNFGRTSVDVAAPGVAIYSTLNYSDSAYGLASGTSMAAPHVSGIAALMLARFPHLTPADMRDILIHTSMPLPGLEDLTVSEGCVDAFAALTELPDGLLELAVLPAPGSTLFFGRAVPILVRVTDVTAVPGATVTGTIAGAGALTFRDDGVSPDQTANDANFTATLTVSGAGPQVQIALTVTAPDKAESTLALVYPVEAPPANDDFSQRTSLDGVQVFATGSNVGATKEIGEPNHANVAGGSSVWWTWTAPAAATVTISTENSGLDTLLAVYRGSSVGGLTLVAANDDHDGSTRHSRVQFTATAGTAYAIAVDGANGQSGPITLSLGTSIAPTNDRFASAGSLTGTSGNVVADLYNATRESGEPDHGSVEPEASVWWRWTAPSSGTARFSATQHLLAVYTGNAVNALTPVLARRDGGATFAAVAGTTYSIAVGGGYGFQNVSSPFMVSFELVPSPANDTFAQRTLLTGIGGTVRVNGEDATPEVGEPEAGLGATVWWTWTAPASGAAVFSLDSDNRDSALVIYTGSDLTGLSLVSDNSTAAFSVRSSRAVFAAIAGTTYQVLVDRRRPLIGPVHLSFELGGAPPNDNFADAAVLTGMTATATGMNASATREPGEPVPTAFGSGATLWWRWTAPATGTVTVSTTAGYVAVYTGTTLGNLNRVSGIGPIVTSTTFHVLAGTTYHIWTDGVFGALGEVSVAVDLVEAPPNDQFSQPMALTGSRSITTATLRNTTLEAFDPSFGWNGVASRGGSAWWQWTAPASGRTQISAAGTNASIVVGVATESLPDFRQLRGVNDEEHANGVFVFEATGGTTYLIALAVPEPATAEPFSLKLVQVAEPANDRFVNRAALTGTAAVVVASNEGAYVDRFERGHAGEPAHASLWWTWTAPVSGWVEIDATGSAFPTNVEIYIGDEVDRLTQVAGNWGDLPDRFGPVGFTAVAGTTYQIVLDGHLSATGDVHLSMNQHVAPANDAFADRSLLSGVPVTLLGNNLGATRQVGEPGSGGFSPLNSTVWWTWTAPATGTATVSLAEGDTGFAVAVYTGSSVATLVPVENSDQASFGRRVTFHAEADAVYAIAVGVRDRIPGAFTLSITIAEPPANDMFADRSPLVPSDTPVAGSSRNASLESGEPDDFIGWPSVWWSWTAPGTGRAVLRISGGAPGRNRCAVYTGMAVNQLTLVAESLQSTTHNYVSWSALAGTTYQIRVSMPDGAGDEFELWFDFVDPPANDDFENRVALTGIAPAALGSNLGASGEPGEPRATNFPEEFSVWWSWTAPLTTRMIFSTLGSDFDTCLTIYTGSAVDSLTRIVINDNAAEGVTSSRVVFDAVAGASYQMAVTGTFGAMGEVVLTGIPGAPPVAEAIQPMVQVATAGMPLTLQAQAAGDGPFTYQWLRDGAVMPGETAPTLVLPSVQMFDTGRYAVRVGNEFGESESTVAALEVVLPAPSGARLTNLSTRALGLTGDKVLIPGFVVEGPGRKQLLLRAVGPTLAAAPYDLVGVLPNPRLQLKRFNGSSYDDVATNDNWGASENAVDLLERSEALGAFAITPGSLDAALLVELEPGQYSVVTDDPAGATGIAIVELYDADEPDSTSRLINISNRGYVGAGDDIMIPGFVVSSEGPKTLLIRVVGPTLGAAPYNVGGVLADPTLSIYRRDFVNNTDDLILTNDNWSESPGADRTRGVAAQVHAFALPEGSKDAAFVVTLNPGVYTVHARGKNNTAGVALVEVYAAP